MALLSRSISLIIVLFLAIAIFILLVLSGCCILFNHVNMICLDSHLLMSRLLLLSLVLSGSLLLLIIAILAFCKIVLQCSLLLLGLLQKQHRYLLDSLSWDIALLGERFALCRSHVLAVGSLGVC